MRIAIIRAGQIINALEAEGVEFVTLPDGDTAMEWDDAINSGFEQSPALAGPSDDDAPRRFTPLEFMDLFTEEEQGDLLASALPPVRKFMWMAAGAQFIDLDDARTSAGIAALASLGLITESRRDAVLSGNPQA